MPYLTIPKEAFSAFISTERGWFLCPSLWSKFTVLHSLHVGNRKRCVLAVWIKADYQSALHNTSLPNAPSGFHFLRNAVESPRQSQVILWSVEELLALFSFTPAPVLTYGRWRSLTSFDTSLISLNHREVITWVKRCHFFNHFSEQSYNQSNLTENWFENGISILHTVSTLKRTAF